MIVPFGPRIITPNSAFPVETQPFDFVDRKTTEEYRAFIEEHLPQHELRDGEVQASFYDGEHISLERLAGGIRTNRNKRDTGLVATFTEYAYPDTSVQLPPLATQYELRKKIHAGMKIVKCTVELKYPGTSHDFRPTIQPAWSFREAISRAVPQTWKESSLPKPVSRKEAREVLERFRAYHVIGDPNIGLLWARREE